MFAALSVLAVILVGMWLYQLVDRVTKRSLDVHLSRADLRLSCACRDPYEVTVEHGVKRCVYRGDLIL